MDNVEQAVREVRAELEAGEILADAIAFVAEERGVNPVLLARKVAEYRAPPEPVTPQRSSKVTTMDDERNANRRRVDAMTPEQRGAYVAKLDAAFTCDMRKLLRLLTR